MTASIDLEPYRGYLKMLAEIHLDRRLRGKLDPSDVVQQTLLRAYPALDELRDRQPAVLAAWLRKILSRTLADVVRHYERDRRDIHLERSLALEIDQSASRLAGWLAADHTSPSQAAMRSEDLLRMVAALGRIPEPMRDALVMKHCQQLTIAQIAAKLNRSVPSVASLLRRGLEEVRRLMAEQGDTP